MSIDIRLTVGRTRTPGRSESRRLAAAAAGLLRLLVTLTVCSTLAVGCGSEERAKPARRTVELADIPESVRTAAEKQLPDVEFSDAWKNVERDGKLHSYEIRGKNKNGKTREVRVSATGAILEVE